MGADITETLAALAGAPAGVAELAFNAFPLGTRMTVLTYGLATESADDQLLITDLGREAIELAAARHPQPYADLSLDDIAASMRATLDELAARSGRRIREPRSHAGPKASSLARMSQQLQAAVVRGLIIAVVTGILTTLAVWSSTDDTTTLIVAASASVLGTFLARAGFEGAYDAKRHREGNVHPSDVGSGRGLPTTPHPAG